jgi:hypothetical protein
MREKLGAAEKMELRRMPSQGAHRRRPRSRAVVVAAPAPPPRATSAMAHRSRDLGGARAPPPRRLLTVYIRIKVQLYLQADKSSIVVKGPFSPQV